MEKLHKVEGIKKIGEDSYLLEEDISKAISTNHVIPVYFALSYATEIHHDSPAIGACELGETTNYVDGPFFTEKEAQEAGGKHSSAISHVSYEFSSKIRIKLFSPEQLPDGQLPQIFKYYRNNFVLSTGNFDRLEYHLRPNTAPTPEKIIKFSNLLEKRLRERAKKNITQTKEGLVGIVHNNRPFFCEMKLATEESPWFRHSTFSEKPTPESFSAELEELGISERASEVFHARTFFSFTQVNLSGLFLGIDSIEDLVKYHNLIH